MIIGRPIINRLCLVLCRNKNIESSIKVAPPKKESVNKDFSLIRLKFLIAKSLSTAATKNEIIFIIKR